MRWRTSTAIACALLAACSGQPSAVVAEGATVELSATYQSSGEGPTGTGGVELSIEDLLGLPPGEMTFRSQVVLDKPEFPRFLGLWVVDIAERRVSLSPTGGEPFPGALAVLDDGTYWRIRLEGLAGLDAQVDGGGVEVMEERGALIIELGPGFDPAVDVVIVSFG